jgi:hypothetical protein
VPQKAIACILLACAGLSLMVFQSETPGFESGHLGDVSSHGMALSKSLFVEHRGLMFSRRAVQEDGSITYDAYNRFPLFPFLLTGAAARSGGSDLSRQLYFARQAMNLFFILALIFAFMTVNGILRQPLLSVSIVLMAFSSHFVLYYHDLVFNDIPALFGCILVFYLISRSRNGIGLPLAAGLAAVAVSTGWQAISVLAAWLVADSVHVWLVRRKQGMRLGAMIRRPAFVAFAAGGLWAGTVLGLQLLNELKHVGGSFVQIPTMVSFLARAGLKGHQRLNALPGVDWGDFLLSQARRIWLMILPFNIPYSIPASGLIGDLFTQGEAALTRHVRDWRVIAALVGLTAFFLALLSGVWLAVRRRLLDWRVSAAWGLSGAIWALSMRHYVAFHDFESIFFIGIPLVLYLAFFLQSRFLQGIRMAATLAVGSTLLFAVCVYRDGTAKSHERSAHAWRFMEFQAIADRLPPGAEVYVDGDRRMADMAFRELDFFLGDAKYAPRSRASYIVSLQSCEDWPKLTGNARLNLFRRPGPYPAGRQH